MTKLLLALLILPSLLLLGATSRTTLDQAVVQESTPKEICVSNWGWYPETDAKRRNWDSPWRDNTIGARLDLRTKFQYDEPGEIAGYGIFVLDELLLCKGARVLVALPADLDKELTGQEKTALEVGLGLDNAAITANTPYFAMLQFNFKGVTGGDVTGFLPIAGRMLICTGNPGKVFEVAKGYLSRGTFTSKVLNGGLPSKWGRISWESQIPSSTKVYFRTRSGNTARPDTTWSLWSESLREKSGADISSPPRRYFQWQAVLESDNPGVTPRLTEVTVSYLRRNRPPMVSPIRLMPQGLFVKRSPSTVGKPEVKKTYPYEVEKLLNNKKKRSTENPFQGKKEYEKRFRMAGWNANDPNGDELRYNVHYRGISESTWRPLELNIAENSVVFDTESMADGKYLLKVTAHDSLDNPGGRAESSERISPVLTVDNTPPSIQNFHVSKLNNGLGFEVSFKVRDQTSKIERVEVAVDAEKARRVAPVDEILDSLEEDFRLVREKVSPGEHTVTVQAYDQCYNLVTVRQSIKTP